jgi:histidinol-phosphate aminotransferase
MRTRLPMPLPPARKQVDHGSIDHLELSRLGIDPSSILDFSSNIMPVEPSPLVWQAIQSVRWDAYPDRHCMELIAAIADLHQIPPDGILVGNGCCDLIHTVAGSVLQAGDLAMVVGPTFSEYARCSHLAGARVIEVPIRFPVRESSQLLHELGNSIEESKPQVVWLCNPNNPTGDYIESEKIFELANRYAKVKWIVDESYIDFVSRPSLLDLPQLNNVIVLRSMTKYYAMAGLRLGYAAMESELRDRWAEAQIPWQVNAIAQAAGVAAIESKPHYDHAMQSLALETLRLRSRLVDAGFAPNPTETGYFLLPVEDATSTRNKLIQKGILVRDCTSFGLRSHLRISVRSRLENERFIDAIGSRELRYHPSSELDADRSSHCES